jgi:leucyl aminopeptidase
LRRVVGTACTALSNKQVAAAALALPHLEGQAAEALAQAITEAAILSQYRYTRFRAEAKPSALKQLTLAVTQAQRAKAEQGVQQGSIIAAGVCLTRDLINGPSNLVTPTYLAGQARQLAKQLRLKCLVLSFEQLKRQGFGGIVAVSQGSDHPAQFIVLEYRPARAKHTIALVGKGVTFDTGGISLKPSAKMELMKYDMSGAAAVLGALHNAARLKLPVRVVGIVAATENMPSGKAQKPGDIYTSLSGKTVEVLNTDAEGRLILADCLHYAKRYKPDVVVDLATLTGACVVALGTQAIGLMSNHDKAVERIQAAAERTHERVWRLPLWAEYADQLKSDVADIQNISKSGEAGTIMGGKFLEFFVGDMPWVHLDIASTAWTDSAKPYVPKGAVGIGVRLLTDLLVHWE